MYKAYLLIALAIAGVSAQNAAEGETGAAEPYSYGYQTDSHGAAEQRDPSGKVTGYYTIAEADGRQRRVEYVADESGFRAKVQTNEVGTKSANPADVEVLAEPANAEQYAYQAPVQQQVSRTTNSYVQQPYVQQSYVQQPYAQQQSYVQQPYGYNYGYYPGSYGSYGSYGSNGVSGYGAQNAVYGYGPQAGYRYGEASTFGPAYGTYSSYNNHLPSQYYKNQVQPLSYNANSVRTSGYRTSQVTGNQPGYSYQTIGVPGSVQAPQTSYSSSAQGRSSNYVVLQKRSSEAAKEENEKKNN